MQRFLTPQQSHSIAPITFVIFLTLYICLLFLWKSVLAPYISIKICFIIGSFVHLNYFYPFTLNLFTIHLSLTEITLKSVIEKRTPIVFAIRRKTESYGIVFILGSKWWTNVSLNSNRAALEEYFVFQNGFSSDLLRELEFEEEYRTRALSLAKACRGSSFILFIQFNLGWS